MKKERLIYPDLLRIVAAFFVVLIHVTSIVIRENEIGSGTWEYALMLNSISRWPVPVFFMISGMFLLDPEYDFNTRVFFKKKVGRICWCIVVWGLFYSFVDQYLFSTISYKSLIVALYGVITDNAGYHLWFLYTLLILYIATPALRIITKNATAAEMRYILICWFLLSILVGQINEMANELFGFKRLLPFTAITFTGYSGYYIAGYYFAKKRLEGFKYVKIITALTFLVLIPLINIVLSREFDKNNIVSWESPLGVGSCVLALVIFILFASISSKNWKKCTINLVLKVSEYTFGVYLTHVFFVYLLFHILKIHITGLMLLPWSFLVFCISLMTTVVLKRVPIFKNLI